MKDTQSRKWQLTVNNPLETGVTHDYIKMQMDELKYTYWCMSDEIGEQGTPHTHIYMCFDTPRKFSTLKKRFATAHFEMAKGTSKQNMEYITKSGKWAKDSKKETCVEGTFEEFGELPIERQGKRNDLDDLYGMIKEGLSDYEILELEPSYLLHMDKVERARQVVIQEASKNTWRDIEVTYIYGDTGSGKTRGVMEHYGYENVFRVTDYQHPFDNYKGQDVVVFEEFRSSLRVGDMLNYLDGYPLELPCRYANKYACFTKVYLITNIPLGQQYSAIQLDSYDTYLAFLRRIKSIHHYACGKVEKSHIELLGNGFRQILDGEHVPFS